MTTYKLTDDDYAIIAAEVRNLAERCQQDDTYYRGRRTGAEINDIFDVEAELPNGWFYLNVGYRADIRSVPFFDDVYEDEVASETFDVTSPQYFDNATDDFIPSDFKPETLKYYLR